MIKGKLLFQTPRYGRFHASMFANPAAKLGKPPRLQLGIYSHFFNKKINAWGQLAIYINNSQTLTLFKLCLADAEKRAKRQWAANRAGVRGK